MDGGRAEAKGLGRLEVDDQLELHGLLHRQVGGLRTLEDAVHVVGGAPEVRREVRPIRHQPAGLGKLSVGKDGWQPALGREGDEARPVVQEHAVRERDESTRPRVRYGLKRPVEIRRAAHLDGV